MKILFATDGSDTARDALDFLLAFPFPEDSSVLVVTVVDTDSFDVRAAERLSGEDSRSLAEARAAVEEDARDLLAREAARLRDAGWAGSTRVLWGHPSEEIVRTATEVGSELIVVGSHGLTGIRRYILGSVSTRLAHYAPCSVLIVREPVAETGNAPTGDATAPQRLRVLLAYDDSPSAKRAAGFCADLPLGEGVELTLLTVLPLVTLYRQDVRQRMSRLWQEKKRIAEEALERVAREVGWATPHVATELRESPDVSGAIMEAAETLGSDLIVLGHKGRHHIERFLLGSVTDRVTGHAPCSVLVVRAAP